MPCPKNSEIKKIIISVLKAGFEGTTKELKEAIIKESKLTQEDLEDKTDSGKRRFDIRFSVQLSELVSEDIAIKEEDKTIHFNYENQQELIQFPQQKEIDSQTSNELEMMNKMLDEELVA